MLKQSSGAGAVQHICAVLQGTCRCCLHASFGSKPRKQGLQLYSRVGDLSSMSGNAQAKQWCLCCATHLCCIARHKILREESLFVTCTRSSVRVQFPQLGYSWAHNRYSTTNVVQGICCMHLPSRITFCRSSPTKPIITIRPPDGRTYDAHCLTWDAQLAPVLVRHPGNISTSLEVAKRPASYPYLNALDYTQ